MICGTKELRLANSGLFAAVRARSGVLMQMNLRS